MALADPIRVSRGGVAPMEHKATIEEMRHALELDGCRPIYVNSMGDSLDLAEKGDAFADWYEGELRERYEQFKQSTDNC